MSTIITPITMPFASGRTSGTLPNVIPAIEPNALNDNVANQTTGFPVLQATSLGGGGIPVQEGEMNGVLNFYTNLLFQMGQGYQFTFDTALVSAVGGYPQGAILWCASNNTFQISLQNNNDKNFVTTPSFINDGIWWQNLVSAGEFPNIVDDASTGSVTIGTNQVGGTQVLKTSDTAGHMAHHQVEVSAGVARAVTYLKNPDGTTNHGTFWEPNRRPFCVNLDNLSVTTRSQAYIQDCTNTYSTGDVVGGGFYSLNMQKILIDTELYSISISGDIQNVMNSQGYLGYIELPLTQINNSSSGPLTFISVTDVLSYVGVVTVNPNDSIARLNFTAFNVPNNGDILNGSFSILFTGF